MAAALKACSECKVKLVQFDLANVQTSLPQVMQAQLQSDPGVSYVLGTFGAATQLSAALLRQLGKTSIKLAGTSGATPDLQALAAGKEQALVVSGRDEQTWSSVDVVGRFLSGQKVPDDVPVSTVLLTPDTAGPFVNGYVGPKDYEQQFKQLWGKG
jgi:ribose transport system substrate-binding protein